MAESSADVIKRYLADAIAGCKSLETRLLEFSKEGTSEAARTAFHQHALKTRDQGERLTARLNYLESDLPLTKGFLAHIFGASPRHARQENEKDEDTAQRVALIYAAENSGIALYESLAAMAEAAGDAETAQLARGIQSEQQAMAREIWELLPAAALEVYQEATGRPMSGHTERTTA
jgi:ferritin-like metal-binding protein YciE